MKKKVIKNLIISVFICIGICIYNAFVQSAGDYQMARETLLEIYKKRVLLDIFIIWIILDVLSYIGRDKIFKYRYIVAGVLFLTCVWLGLSGSSLGYLTKFFGEEDTGIVFGVSRGIRVDEWGVFTPMTWSQYFDPAGKFSYYSSIVRATKTDVFLEYGQPILSPLMIYRPFQIGYLFLPIENGMAFFWCGRLIALFMCSFEFGRIITKNDKKLSCVYAFCISFAPAVQWWFAINGFVELLVALQLSIVLFDKVLLNKNRVIRILSICGVYICAGMYILSMYPAWMVPFAYILLCLIVWRIVDNKKNIKIEKRDFIYIILFGLLFIASMLYIFHNSSDTISVIRDTVYPGKRFESGGGAGIYLWNYISNIWFAVFGTAPYANTCEAAYFISLFPLGIILYIIMIVKYKKVDLLNTLLIIITCLLVTYSAFGLPDIIAKVLLLENTTPNRSIMAIGFANVIMLFRCVKIFVDEEDRINTILAFATSFIVSGLVVYLTYRTNTDYYDDYMLIVEFLVLVALSLGVFYCSLNMVKNIWCTFFVVILLISGGLVNPIRKGVDSVKNIPELKMVEEVVEQDPNAIWIVEGEGYPITNTIMMKGARTINSTNVYPDIEKWSKIDKENKYCSVYNRYSHIQIYYGDNEDKFILLNPDYYQVFLNYDDLKELDVKYIFTSNDLSYDSRLKFINNVRSYNVFELE